MKKLADTPISVLDLATYPQGGTIAHALQTSRELAQGAERWGYKRYWVAEHHNLEGVASSATVVIMGYLADHTKTIRIGSGGIMLPNHAPLVVAEQIGTLESLHPGRIDLGLGRAPGTDQVTMRALRRGGRGEEFDVQVAELLSYFAPATPHQAVKAIPGAGIDVPVWILGSSLWSAHFAAAIGRPYAFASHFAPGVPALAADSDEKAEFLATSMYQRFLGIIRNTRAPLPPPVESMDAVWSPAERMAVAERMALMVVGGPERVAANLQEIVRATDADELIISSDAFERADRLRSYEIIAKAAGR